jgi:hypothetical protein
LERGREALQRFGHATDDRERLAKHQVARRQASLRVGAGTRALCQVRVDLEHALERAHLLLQPAACAVHVAFGLDGAGKQGLCVRVQRIGECQLLGDCARGGGCGFGLGKHAGRGQCVGEGDVGPGDHRAVG